MITPRRTRLIRVPDLHDFRRVIVALCAGATPAGGRMVVVPTRASAAMLEQTLATRGAGIEPPLLVTRDELYDALHVRSSMQPRRLSAVAREAMAQGAAEEAAAAVGDLPFRVRPGLVAELLRFYDQLRRQSQTTRRFEELLTDALGGGEVEDRGAERLLRQTRFLAQTFAGYEARVASSGAADEHILRERLIADAGAAPLGHVIVTVPDWIADPAGLFVADFDLLSRLPNLAAVDLVCTEGVLASGFHERLDAWWPGLEVSTASDLGVREPLVRPHLICPEPVGDLAPLWFTHRDREEELLAVARRLAATPSVPLERVAIVFKRPLPYLYLAADTLGAARLPFVAFDALPLASEPAVAPVDLVLDALETDFARDATIALLRTPHFARPASVTPESVSALDRALSEARYLGGPDRLGHLAAAWAGSDSTNPRRDRRTRTAAEPALAFAAELASALSALRVPRPASTQLAELLAFLDANLVPLDAAHPLFEREQAARAAMLRILREGVEAHRLHHDPPWSIADLASAVRRWIGEETFLQGGASAGIRLVDDQAVRYGEFDDLTVVGLIENEWPDKPRRNIFYPPALLKALGWPSEKDRHGASDARFIDLLTSATTRVELSAFLLDDEAIVSRSIQLDEVPRARLSTVTRVSLREPLLGDEPLALDASAPAPLEAHGREWLELRQLRSPAANMEFHGSTGPRPGRAWSVSALETYIGCPFRFFAQHILRLDEEPDDDEVMNPRQQGQFVHEVFETFFAEWQEAGHRTITSALLPLAREHFTAVVDRALTRLPEGEAALERTRLLGSPAAAGLGEAVFRMEAERPVAVLGRQLEVQLDGMFTIHTDKGPRLVSLRGKADRIDLLADGTFRLIDYKLGWPPDRSRALQLPIYALCAEQALTALNRRWVLGEAMYLAFKGPRRVVPLFASDAARAEVLAQAQQRLADTLDAIEQGEFPPSPDDVYRCETCSFGSVCRKDYVGDL